MEEAWFRKQGFHSNPFSIKPAAFHNEVVGYKLGRIIKKIKEGSLVFIEAPLGGGKTTILKHLLRIFGGKGRLIHYTHTKSESIDVRGLLLGATFLGRFFGKLPREIILLVDEAAAVRKEECRGIIEFLEKGNLRSVAFFGTVYTPSHFPVALRERLKGNVIRLSSLTPEQAVQLVRRRIGRLPLISDDIIKQVFVRVYYNPRRLLEACEDICREAVSDFSESATQQHVSNVLGSPVRVKRRNKCIKKPARKLIVHEMKIADVENFNLSNIRTYEQEMSLIKQEKGEDS